MGEKLTEKCMFCDTMIEVPAPNQYAVICAPCKQQAYETADRLPFGTEEAADFTEEQWRSLGQKESSDGGV